MGSPARDPSRCVAAVTKRRATESTIESARAPQPRWTRAAVEAQPAALTTGEARRSGVDMARAQPSQTSGILVAAHERAVSTGLCRQKVAREASLGTLSTRDTPKRRRDVRNVAHFWRMIGALMRKARKSFRSEPVLRPVAHAPRSMGKDEHAELLGMFAKDWAALRKKSAESLTSRRAEKRADNDERSEVGDVRDDLPPTSMDLKSTGERHAIDGLPSSGLWNAVTFAESRLSVPRAVRVLSPCPVAPGLWPSGDRSVRL